MTESDWLVCASPAPMLDCLKETGQADDFRLRLFGAACCRRVWQYMRDERSRDGVRLAECVTLEQPVIGFVSKGCFEAYTGERNGSPAEFYAAEAAALLFINISDAATCAAQSAAMLGGSILNSALGRERLAQAALVRCIFGTLFRPLQPLDPSLLTWNGGVVLKLAQAAYDERLMPSGELDPGRLAVLADALEDAASSDEQLLRHLRSEGPHARGCVAVDAILGL